MTDLRAEQRVGPWTLVDLLGGGGNAEVWRAGRTDGHVVAVKFLRTRKTDSSRWERFRREVEYMAGLGEREGVLPVEEYDLPETIPKGGRAWYSMPVATPLADALATATLHEVVGAFAKIATTLAALWEEDGVAHRDIKPGNLYSWRDDAAVGDFGLLWQPDAATLTASSEIPGPFSFTAPELFRNDLEPEQIDYSRSDVFSLAKTLWAVARGADFAIPGEHQPGAEGADVALSRPHPNSGALDGVIARATVADPGSRPTMSELADELKAWTELADPEAGTPDLSGVSAQIREQLEPSLQREREDARLVESGRLAVARAREQLTPLFAQLESDVPGAATHVRDSEIEGVLRSYEEETMQGPDLVLRESIAARVSNRAEPLAYVLHMGVVIEVFTSRDMRIGGAFLLAHEQVLGAQTDQFGPNVVEPGSIAAEQAVQEASHWIIENAQGWLERFAQG